MMNIQWINFGMLNTAFLMLFAFAEYLHQRKNWAVEHTRKLVHISSGLMALSFPFAFDHWLPVALTTAGFAGLLWITKRNGWLNAINGIERKSHGSYLYPVTLMICFLMATELGNPMYYLMPMLLMAVGDPMACLVGKRFPLFQFNIPGGSKSIGGMLGCFLAAGLMAYSLFMICPMSLSTSPLVASGILAATATMAEVLSGRGLDNITMPMTTIATLYFLQASVMIA